MVTIRQKFTSGSNAYFILIAACFSIFSLFLLFLLEPGWNSINMRDFIGYGVVLNLLVWIIMILIIKIRIASSYATIDKDVLHFVSRSFFQKNINVRIRFRDVIEFAKTEHYLFLKNNIWPYTYGSRRPFHFYTLDITYADGRKESIKTHAWNYHDLNRLIDEVSNVAPHISVNKDLDQRII